jgi:peptidyl-prolyl cis-trans isomerase A (cyclophilin A)
MMIKRRGLLAGLGILAANLGFIRQAGAQTPTAVQDAPPPEPGAVHVTLATPQGDIVLELYQSRAPITAGHFLAMVDQKRIDGGSFYRATRPGPEVTDYGVVQGGVKFDPNRPVRKIAHEPTTQTGVHHVSGAISFGRGEPGSAQSDFFICVGAQTSYDADPSQPGDNLGYAAFGRVIGGMEVVKAILVMPTSPTKGEGVMKGQILEMAVPIKTARRSA